MELYNNATPARVLKSGKDSASWQSLEMGDAWEDTYCLGDTCQNAEVFRVSPLNADYLAFGFSYWPWVFFKSTDAGETWVETEVEKNVSFYFDEVNAPHRTFMDPYIGITSMAFDPLNDDRIYITDWFGIFRSDDGGQTWHEKVKGTQNTVCTDLIAVGNTMLSAHMDTIVFRTDDPTGIWSPSLPVAGGALELAHAWSLAWGPDGQSGDGYVYAGVSVVGDTPRVYSSNDAGITWIKGSPPFAVSENAMEDAFTKVRVAAAPSRPGTVYVANDKRSEGIYRSDDFGATWTKLQNQPGTAVSDPENAEDILVESIAVDPSDENRLHAGVYWDGIWYSTDGGASWSPAAGNNGVYLASQKVDKLVALENGVVWAGCSGGVFKSVDSGQSYTRVLGEELNLAEYEFITSIAWNPDDMDEIFIGTSKGWPELLNIGQVWRTTDGGVTWSDITGDMPVRRIQSLLYVDGYLYAATDGANVYRTHVR